MNNAIFLATHACEAYFNMALDEWMFAKVLESPGSIFLRLYSWSERTITFGHNQKMESAIDSDLLNGTPLIRRITGGRALYHDVSELTYSIAVNSDNPGVPGLNGSMAESSHQIAAALVNFLAKIGLSAHYMRQSSKEFKEKNSLHTQHCFQSRARNEIISDGRKIAASAQRRIGPAFLQHGSIKIKQSVLHPAIAKDSSNLVTDSVIEAISRSDFESKSEIFSKTFSEFFGVGFNHIVLSGSDRKELEIYCEFLKKNRLIKRDLIKQNSLNRGLYLKAVN